NRGPASLCEIGLRSATSLSRGRCVLLGRGAATLVASDRGGSDLDRLTLQSIASRSISGGNKRLFVPSANAIVTPHPIAVAVDAALAGGDRVLLRRAIAHVLEASIGQGEPLHPMHARDADAAEVGKGL